MSTNKVTTGINGLDKILNGGYLAQKPSLIKGGPGSGKTSLSLFFLEAQIRLNHSVILVTCDESPESILAYMDNFGLNGTEHYRSGALAILDFRPHVFDEVAGEYELDVLLFRIMQAKNKNNAQALVIDSLQDLLLGLSNCNKELELLKLFAWSRTEKMTLLTTIAESSSVLKTELLEEYAADCVITMQQKITNNLMTRYLRVIKLRGFAYGTNEYPFSIKSNGVSILPVTETRLNANIGIKYLLTGIEYLDSMLNSKGYLEGSTVMFTGRSGTAKTIFAASLAQHAIKQGKKVLYVSFEESPDELINHLKSVNIDFMTHLKHRKLVINSRRTVEMGLEDHIISIIDIIEHERIDLIVLDPISAFLDMGSVLEIKMLLIRFISYMKSNRLTQIFTELLPDYSGEYSSLSLSSMTDTWIRLRRVEDNGEFNRLISIIKSRGIKISNQVKEFLVTENGIHIEDPYIGEGKMLFGTEKENRILHDIEQEKNLSREITHLEAEIQRLEAQYQAQRHSNDAQYQHEKYTITQKLNELTDKINKKKSMRTANKQLRE